MSEQQAKKSKQNSLIAYGIPSIDRPILTLIKRRLSRIKCVDFVAASTKNGAF